MTSRNYIPSVWNHQGHLASEVSTMEDVCSGRFLILGIAFFRLMSISCAFTLGDGNSKAIQATTLLSELLQGPLKGGNVLLVLGGDSQGVLDVNQILFDHTLPIVSLATDDAQNFLEAPPISFLRGPLLTAVIVFLEIPDKFLDSLDERWNPANLVLINLNTSLNTDDLLEHDAVQRCERIALLEEKQRGADLKYFVYTSETYKSGNEWKSIRRRIGVWETQESFRTKSELLPQRFSSFNGAMLYLGSWCDDFPFLYQHEGKCLGTSLELLDILVAKFNFSYDVQMETADHNWGSKENGIWTGMLGDLVYNDKDLVVNYFLLTEERKTDFDTTYAYYSEGFAFVLKIPPPLPKWPGLLYPFTGVMWVTTICTVVVIALLLTSCLYALPEKQRPDQAFLLILGGIVNQSVHHRLTNSWSRLWTGWWWLAGAIITMGYTSNLIAFLTVPVYPSRVETIDKLASSGIRVCMQDYGNFLPEALKISPDPSLYKLGHSLDLFPYDSYLSFGPGFEMVSNGTHALVDTYSYVVHLVEAYNHTEDTYLMREHVYPGHLAWFLKKNSPYTSLITGALTQLVESGLVNHLYMKHFVKELGQGAADKTEKISQSKPLQLEQLLGAFIIWAIGIVTSFMAFALEYMMKN